MFITFAVIIAFVALFNASKASHQISRLEDKLSQTQSELANLRYQLSNKEKPTASVSTAVEDMIAVPEPSLSLADSSSDKLSQTQHHVEDAVSKTDQTIFVQLSSLADEIDTSQVGIFEKRVRTLLTNIRENWLVWVGALAMLIGSGYLMQVIGNRIEFSPLMRVTFAFSLSLVTVLTGEWFHSREQKISERAIRVQGFTYVPAAITGAGLMGIYCTAIFAFIVYQMLTPSVSLFILAVTAIASLALSLRQGPLMTVLGLIGGYSAPLWINSTEPNYFLLAGYICAISVAASVLMQSMRKSWISPCITLPHIAWMAVMIEFMPDEIVFSWLSIYLSFTLYLIFLVPRMGWKLEARYRHHQNKWTHSPILIAVSILFLALLAITKLSELTILQIAYYYCVFIAIIWLPALRKGWSLRIFLSSIVVAAVAILIFSIAYDVFYLLQWEFITWLALAISIMLIGLRVYRQALSDRSQFSTVLLLSLVPSMTLLALCYLHTFIPNYAWQWTFFTLGIASSYIFLAQRFHSLAYECSAVVHAIVTGCFFIWLNGTWLTMAMSVQVVIMAIQIQAGRFPPANWAVKVVMSMLAVRLTLLPFISAWQPLAMNDWSWGVISYLPALCVLLYARSVLQKVDLELADWFEGAFLHVFLMTLFTQTHYWLMGQYDYFGYIDFTTAIIFANQALVMGLVYSYRSQFTQRLTQVYQLYSYCLWSLFVGLMVLLNSIESPLLVNNVAAQAMPIFNMLTAGWLLPASILLFVVVKRWNILRIEYWWVAVVGSVLGAMWLGMSIRQFWQSDSMTLFQPTSMAELFSYSVAGLMVGGLLTWSGVIRKTPIFQHIGVAVLACVALKVFLWDVRSLDGFWRAISFLGLGGSLIALGWLFQKLNRSVVQVSES